MEVIDRPPAPMPVDQHEEQFQQQHPSQRHQQEYQRQQHAHQHQGTVMPCVPSPSSDWVGPDQAAWLNTQNARQYDFYQMDRPPAPTAIMPSYPHGGGRGRPIANDAVFLTYADKTHSWPFGAAAELIHNSSDAGATEVRVSIDHLGPDRDRNFVVVDNGRGMTHDEMAQLFELGKESGYDSRIGCNGVGFKQGVLRLGETAVVITVQGKQVVRFVSLVFLAAIAFASMMWWIFLSAIQAERRAYPLAQEDAVCFLILFPACGRSRTPMRTEVGEGGSISMSKLYV